jgi:ELWxxDGT repeat protein
MMGHGGGDTSDAGKASSDAGTAMTPAGFGMLADINRSGSSGPMDFVVAGSHTFFTADDGVHGRELWVTDGTTPGTRMVKDIRAGVSTPGIRTSKLAVIGEKIVFTGADDGTTHALFVSDGTEAGTQKLMSISVVTFYASTATHVYFTATETATGTELWTSDGTAAGTHIVRDDNPGVADSEIRTPMVFGNRLLFHAFHRDQNGTEVGYVFGTSGAVGDAVALTPSSGKQGVQYFADGIALGDRMFFQWANDAVGSELWISDGTPSGTHVLKDCWPGTTSAYPQAFSVLGKKVLFFAYDGSSGSFTALWESDGTEAGTKVVAPVALSPNQMRMIPKGDKYYFPGRRANSSGSYAPELEGVWETDGTTAGTRLISNAAVPAAWSFVAWGQVKNPTMVAAGDKLVFFGFSKDTGTEPWVSDGTMAGTLRLADVYPGNLGCTFPSSGLVALGNKAYFIPAIASGNLTRFFETDGTMAGTHASAPDGASPDGPNSVGEEPVRMGNILLFGGTFDARGAELYKL